MIGMACPYQPRVHKIIHPDLENYIKREVSDENLRDSLFIYFQTEYENFVIAHWTNQSHTAFMDVMNLGPSLSNFTREKADALREMLGTDSGVRAQDAAKQLRRGERLELGESQETNDKQKDLNEWVRRSAVSVSMAS